VSVQASRLHYEGLLMSIVEQTVEPLAAGDNLSRDEFLRRWYAEPSIKRAELIGGIVYMPSPVAGDHGDTEFNVAAWLGLYAMATPGTQGSNNATVLMLADAPQPDVHLRLLPEAGGRCRLDGTLLRGAPELAAEVSRTSAAYDLHQKLELYQEAGVREYVAVLLFEQEIRWYRLGDDGVYHVHTPENGIWRSQVFPGLWLDGRALLEGKMQRVAATLQEGLASPEHGAFLAELARRIGG